MKTKFLGLCLSALLLGACSSEMPSPEKSEVELAAAAGEYERGPHNGRMLRDGDFAIEVTIFETGVPPEFHLYAYNQGKPISPESVRASVKLSRLGGKSDLFSFKADGDHLVGSGVVVEPHSFDVEVTAKHAGKDHKWAYASHEGRTMMPAAVAQAAGISIERAGPAQIAETLTLMGRVAMNTDLQANVRATYPGPVKSVHAQVGDLVRAGQTLAVVENSDSLRPFNVKAPITGTVLARMTNVGDVAGDQPLFEIADLSQVWIELNAFGTDAGRVRPGMPVNLKNAEGEVIATSKIQRILPLADPSSQSVVLRAPLPNAVGLWRPGMAVTAEVTLSERNVPLAVKTAALQRFRDFTVVFARFGDTYEVRMLELGQQDGEYVEVLGGIDPETPYVVDQSFLIRADIEKSGASHDH